MGGIHPEDIFKHVCMVEELVMTIFSRGFYLSIKILIILMTLLSEPLCSVVVNNFVDPLPVYTVRGSQMSLLGRKQEDEKRPYFSFSISPYTQIIKACYGPSSAETQRLGDRIGTWGMGAMARDLIANYASDRDPEDYIPVYGDPEDFPLFWNRAKTHRVALNAMQFTNQRELAYSVDFDYEKIGLRTEFCFEPAEGIVVSIQAGVLDQKASDPKFQNPATSAEYVESTEALSASPVTAAFMWNLERDRLLDELGMHAKGYQEIALDDFTAQVALYYPIEFGGKKDEFVTLIPRVTLGFTVPGEKIWETKPLATEKESVLKMLLPRGADGFTGFSMEGATSLDFKNTINLTFSGGYTFFKERARTDLRVPNNEFQSVLYPFKPPVNHKRGGVWNLTASMFSDGFVQGMKCYADYSWIVKRRDTITVTDSDYVGVFKAGCNTLARLSEFRVGVAHLGLIYEMTDNLQAGTSLQAVLHGTQVYSPYTFTGTLSIVF